MSTLKVNAIRGTGASSDAISVNSTDGTCTANITNPRSFRNLIINGSCIVAQRSQSDTSNNYYTTVDRWNYTSSQLEENVTRSQESLSSSDTGPWAKGFRNAWKIQNGNQTGGADANGYIIPQYSIEAQDLATSGWDYTSASSYLTLSFWVKSSVAQTFYGFLRTMDGTSQAWSFNYALSANTWTKVTKKIPGNSNIQIDNNNGSGLTIYLPLFLGTDRTNSGNVEETWAAYSSSNRTKDFTTTWYTTNDATWHLTGVQLEVGDIATDFEHRSYGDELARCQRYFFMQADDENSPIGLGALNTATAIYCHHFFPVTMRANPSIYQVSGADYFRFFNNGGGANVDGDWSIWNGRKTNAQISATLDGSLTSGGAVFGVNNNATARLGFSAEL